MGEYDAALKLLLRGAARVIVKELAGEPVRRWLNVELPEIVQNTRLDLLGEGAAGRLIHIELQSGNDVTMALRMAEYCLRIYRLFGRLPRQVVLYVGEPIPTMPDSLAGPDCSFRYRLVDIRSLDSEQLLESEDVGDNVMAVLGRLRDGQTIVRRLIQRIVKLESPEREQALSQLLILAGLRQMEETIEEEASKMPILNDILDHKVLGREYKRGWQGGRQEGQQEGRQEGELALLRQMMEKRFGPLPAWVEQKLAQCAEQELNALGLRLLDAKTVDELWAS